MSDQHILAAQAFTGHVRSGLHHLNSAVFLLQGDARKTYFKKIALFEKYLEEMPTEAFVSDTETPESEKEDAEGQEEDDNEAGA